ncbi:MAG: PD-(D/E)XK nuclease family protein [Chloroflexota bacterium]|nr:MAG: hypothetical protein DLM70_18000 [Chloroflexota bacterium]
MIVSTQNRTQFIHASKVDRHAECPARYAAEQGTGRATASAQQLEEGLLVHQILRDFCSPAKGVALGSNIGELIESNSHRFETFGERTGEIKEQARSALWSAQSAIQRLGVAVLAVEVSLCSSRMPVAVLPDTILPGLHLMLKGRIDAIGLTGNTLILIDWKTGRFVPTEDGLTCLPSSTIYEFLAKHSFLREHGMLDVETIKIAQVQVPSGETVTTMLTNEQRDGSKALIREMAINLDAKTFPARRNTWCDWCPVNHACELYQADVGDAF